MRTIVRAFPWLLLALICGCGRDDARPAVVDKAMEAAQPRPKEDAPKGPIDKVQAIEIAKAHLKIRSDLPSKFSVDADVGKDGEWHVLVWRLPAVPGGFDVVVIDKAGTVLRVEGGE